ncbi:hypothetical protein B0H65DRAFT_454518 [Neurospora tetraspora]|uniref:DUF7918 domain-containing protein n=1 Tax=Neurospora tetraspora TaxID=94610 RepID=A0AAE0MX94_9PEZI|nr:hypothetical protein B0H65DRAFT_454518 [Neurospora tetraspora]
MAILTGYPGLEVTVEVDGQRAQEYDAPADEVEARAKETNFYSIPQVPIQGSGSPYTIKYIESKPGKPFAFEIDSTNFFIPSPDAKKHMVEYQCFLDGTPTGYYRLVGGTKKRMRSYKSGNNNSGWKRHEFQFSTLEIVEGGDEKQVDRTKEYGTLLVKLWHVIVLQRREPKRALQGPVPVQSVSEKALKGRSVDNKVHFTSEPISGSWTEGKFGFVDPERRPFAIFEFRYRTMEGLMCEGIVPRPVKNEDDQVTDIENEHQPFTRIKPEPENTRGIKRELMDPTPFPVCYKLRRLENGKVEIDLTDD